MAATKPYALPGMQVEPSATYWLVGKHLSQAMPIEGIIAKFQDGSGKWKPEIFFPVDDATIKSEINELANRAASRGTPLPPETLSDFLNLQNPPFGAIFNTKRDQYRVDHVNEQEKRILLQHQQVKSGGELARMFENETPGLLHRQVVNWVLFNRPDLSPIRQARIWMALDVTLYSALSPAWFFKWGAGDRISFRLRPYEYDRGQSFAVLFDKVGPNTGDDTFDAKGMSKGGDPRTCSCPSPGTPRHPAYPSGHSTFSAAVSRILEYFLSPDTLGDSDEAIFAKVPNDNQRFDNPLYLGAELRKLANNIGEARLWAGVHWKSDHSFGQAVGRAVADCVIEQLRADCVPQAVYKKCEKTANEMPPDLKKLEASRNLPKVRPV